MWKYVQFLQILLLASTSDFGLVKALWSTISSHGLRYKRALWAPFEIQAKKAWAMSVASTVYHVEIGRVLCISFNSLLSLIPITTLYGKNPTIILCISMNMNNQFYFLCEISDSSNLFHISFMFGAMRWSMYKIYVKIPTINLFELELYEISNYQALAL